MPVLTMHNVAQPVHGMTTKQHEEEKMYGRSTGLLAISFIHLFIYQRPGTTYMSVVNVNPAVSCHPRASCTRGYPHVFSSANRNMWVCGSAVFDMPPNGRKS